MVEVPDRAEFDALTDAHRQLTDAHNMLIAAHNDLVVSVDILKATVASHTHDTAPPPPPPPRFPGDPGDGLRYGCSVEGGDIAKFEGQIQHVVGVHRSYLQANDTATRMITRAGADAASGRIPLISTKLPGSWAAVASGNYDAWINERLTGLAMVNGPVWLVLHHEPRGDGEPSDWVAMQQRARGLIDASPAAGNVALVGILNGWSFTAGEAAAYYHEPGTGVHVMGFDSYNPWFPGGTKPWKSAEDTLAPGLAAMDWGYPTLVGEYGCRQDPSNPGRSAQWIRDAYAYAREHRFVGLSYFNSGLNSPDGPWTLSGDRLAAFTDCLTAANASLQP